MHTRHVGTWGKALINNLVEGEGYQSKSGVRCQLLKGEEYTVKNRARSEEEYQTLLLILKKVHVATSQNPCFWHPPATPKSLDLKCVTTAIYALTSAEVIDCSRIRQALAIPIPPRLKFPLVQRQMDKLRQVHLRIQPTFPYKTETRSVSLAPVATMLTAILRRPMTRINLGLPPSSLPLLRRPSILMVTRHARKNTHTTHRRHTRTPHCTHTLHLRTNTTHRTH
jgi:hypothetical protein